jgi:hypothetical protein
MYFFTFHAVPGPKCPDSENFGGAFVNCWIDQEACSKALAVAKHWIEERQGWIITATVESKIVERTEYEDNSEGRRYFEQALIDKEVFVVHRYPADDARLT